MDITLWIALIIGSVLIGILINLPVLLAARANERAALIYERMNEEMRQAEADKAAKWAKKMAERAARQAEADAEREDNETWGLIREYCPVLEAHMTAATVGELKRALALPEAEKLREELLAKNTQGALAAQIDPYYLVSLQLHMHDLRILRDEDAIPRDDHQAIWFRERNSFGAWLEELAVVADAQARANRMDQRLPAAGEAPSGKGRF